MYWNVRDEKMLYIVQGALERQETNRWTRYRT